MRKVLMVIAILYALVRVPVHLATLAGIIPTGSADWAGQDLALNLEAARRLAARQDLYWVGPLPTPDVYHYSPLYAAACHPASRLPFPVVAVAHSLLTLASGVALYLLWRQLFKRWQMARPLAMLEALLPLWLIYGAFYGDLSFLNVYTILCLLASLLIYAVVEERLPLAVAVAWVILQVKPHWAFALGVPLLIGRWRFALRLWAWTLAAYLGTALAWMLLAGWDYGLAQYRDYASFLLGMTDNFFWAGAEPSLGYNHSLLQIAYHSFGVSPAVRVVVTVVKVILELPLIVLGVRSMVRRWNAPAVDRAAGVEMAWLLYLAAFLWLDVIWEITLGIVVFTWLAAELPVRREYHVATWLFVLYALQDVWMVAMYAAVGDRLMEGYFWLDPATHIPVVMLALLGLVGGFLAIELTRPKLAPSGRHNLGETP